MKAKLQAPSTKLQGMVKTQVRMQFGQTAPPKRRPCEYSQHDPAFAVVQEDGSGRHAFDLEERTARFGEAIVRFAKKIPRGPDNNRLIDQLIGCGTSVGANYCEANEGLSRKDFHCIIGRCRKEAKETKFFLRMVAASEPTLAEEARVLFCEAKELHLIFCAMFRNSG